MKLIDVPFHAHALYFISCNTSFLVTYARIDVDIAHSLSVYGHDINVLIQILLMDGFE